MLGILPVLGTLAAAVPDTTVPPDSASTDETPASTLADVVSATWDNLGTNGYQTGVALVVATLAVVAMLNQKVKPVIIVPVAIGAFWFGWLGWNTMTGRDNPLFPGDVQATKLWDVAFASDEGFLLVVIVACIAAVFLWRKGTPLLNKVVIVAGAVLGSSFLYNVYESLRLTT